MELAKVIRMPEEKQPNGASPWLTRIIIGALVANAITFAGLAWRGGGWQRGVEKDLEGISAQISSLKELLILRIETTEGDVDRLEDQLGDLRGRVDALSQTQQDNFRVFTMQVERLKAQAGKD